MTFDELDPAATRELEVHADSCASCGPALSLLRRAQALLEGDQGEAPINVCPSADELYDFGRGPGARPMSEPERMSLKAHLAGCAACAALVESLASRPPVPLIEDELEPEVEPTAPILRPAWRRFVWAPIAAAAAVLVIAIWPSESSSRERSVGTIRFPAEALLRGTSDDALLYPRDAMLRGEAGLFATPAFELAPQPRATSYRVRLYGTDGRAFATARTLGEVDGASPSLDASALAGQLTPGHFTWEAWAVVDGLDVPLGRRDFEVRLDQALVDAIDARRAAPEPVRSEAILHLLHDAGFDGDARAFARELPASPERDAYLARRPGR